jgi:hypothetical protein
MSSRGNIRRKCVKGHRLAEGKCSKCFLGVVACMG